MFHPGETITHRFIIPFGIREIDYVIVSYKQNDHIILEKKITSDQIEDIPETRNLSIVQYELTQTESLQFEDWHNEGCNNSYTMQLNVYTTNGTRHASNILKEQNGIQYYREVMRHE